jgi:hypothetical protein
MKSASGRVFGMVMLAGALALAIASVDCASSNTVTGGTGGHAGGAGGSATGTGGRATTGTGGSATSGTGGSVTTGSGGATTSGTGGATTSGTGGDATAGTGGITGTGGAASGTGGTLTLGCASPVAGASSGLLTDFSTTTWNNTTGNWGVAPLIGSKFSYAGPAAVDGGAMSTATAAVDTTAQNLHFTATVEPAGYAGAGLSFDECATAGAFNAIQFTLLGTTGGCALELQLQTFDQKPTTGSPAGGCTGTCQNYPKKTNLPLPTSTTVKTTVTVGLNTTDLPLWTAADASELVGLQWQVTVPAPADGGAQTACTVDLRIDDITFITQ